MDTGVRIGGVSVTASRSSKQCRLCTPSGPAPGRAARAPQSRRSPARSRTRPGAPAPGDDRVPLRLGQLDDARAPDRSGHLRGRAGQRPLAGPAISRPVVRVSAAGVAVRASLIGLAHVDLGVIVGPQVSGLSLQQLSKKLAGLDGRAEPARHRDAAEVPGLRSGQADRRENLILAHAPGYRAAGPPRPRPGQRSA